MSELLKSEMRNSRTTACSNSSLLFCLCAFMQPLIDCAICYKTFRGEIEQEPQPYVHCVHKPALTEVSLFTGRSLFLNDHTAKTEYNFLNLFSDFFHFSFCSEWQEMKAGRVDRCNTMGYSSGAPTLLTSKGTE